MNIREIRRTNLRQLAKIVGSISQLANQLDKAQSQLSHLIGKNPIKGIGDKLAADVEQAFNKPPGWMDHIQTSEPTSGVLGSRVPLISWKEIPAYVGIQKDVPEVTTWINSTVNLSSLAFALNVYGDSMESGSGMSFPEGALILVDPQEQAKSGDFVVVQIQPEREVTFKQLMGHSKEVYLKPLNQRYQSLNYAPQTKIWGVVKQLLVNF